MVIELLAHYHGRERSLGRTSSLARLNTISITWCLPASGQSRFKFSSDSDMPGHDADDTTLRSAHLTTWVIYRQMQKAAMEILQFATAAGIDVVLLKGISIGDEMYASPHHRIMGDIDLLVSADNAVKLSELLKSRGYQLRAPDDGPRVPATHHHLPELRHPD